MLDYNQDERCVGGREREMGGEEGTKYATVLHELELDPQIEM